MHRLLFTALIACLLTAAPVGLPGQTQSKEPAKKQSTSQQPTKKKSPPKKSSTGTQKKATKTPPKEASKKTTSTKRKPVAHQEKVEPKPAVDGASPWLGKPTPAGEKAGETGAVTGETPRPADELDEVVGKTKDGRTVFAGTRGGHYYLTDSGNRVYVQEFEGAKIIGKTADGRTIYEGPRSGHYYYNASGNKTYVPKNR